MKGRNRKGRTGGWHTYPVVVDLEVILRFSVQVAGLCRRLGQGACCPRPLADSAPRCCRRRCCYPSSCPRWQPVGLARVASPAAARGTRRCRWSRWQVFQADASSAALPQAAAPVQPSPWWGGWWWRLWGRRQWKRNGVQSCRISGEAGGGDATRAQRGGGAGKGRRRGRCPQIRPEVASPAHRRLSPGLALARCSSSPRSANQMETISSVHTDDA